MNRRAIISLGVALLIAIPLTTLFIYLSDDVERPEIGEMQSKMGATREHPLFADEDLTLAPRPKAAPRTRAASAPASVTSEEKALEPSPHSILFQVVDTAGKPQPGIDVEVFAARDFSATTGADGFARIEFPPRIAKLIPNIGAFARARITAAIGRVTFETWDPKKPIRLKLHPFGSLVVEVCDNMGAPLPEVRELRLDNDAIGLHEKYLVSNGRTVITGIPARHSFKVSVSPHAVSSQSGLLTGPRVAGATEARTVFCDLRAPILRATLISPEGGALPDEARVACFIQSGERRGDWRRAMMTRDSDRVRISLPRSKRPPTDLRIEVIRDRRFWAAAKLKLPALPASAFHDVGQVILEGAVILAKGTVLDAKGKSVRRAFVRVEFTDDKEQNAARRRSASMLSMMDGEYVPGIPLQALMRSRPVVRADGRFEIWGLSSDGRYHVRAGSPLHADDVSGPHVGAATGLRLRLNRGARLSGGVDHDGLPHDLVVRVSHVDGRPVGEIRLLRRNFAFPRVPVGPVRVSVHPVGKQTTLAIVDDVIMKVSRKSKTDPRSGIRRRLVMHDDRLDRIRVPSSRCITITVRGKTGGTVPNVTLEPLATDLRPRQTNLRGEACFLSAHCPMTVSVSAPGYRSRKLENVAANQEVKLRRGLPIVIDATRVLPGHTTCSLRIWRHSGPRRLMDRVANHETNPSRPIAVTVGGPGRYVVTVTGGRVRHESKIEVGESREPQRFVFAPKASKP